MKNYHKQAFDTFGTQVGVIMEGIIQASERENMRKIDEELASREFPEFVNLGRPVTEEEAKPM